MPVNSEADIAKIVQMTAMSKSEDKVILIAGFYPNSKTQYIAINISGEQVNPTEIEQLLITKRFCKRFTQRSQYKSVYFVPIYIYKLIILIDKGAYKGIILYYKKIE